MGILVKLMRKMAFFATKTLLHLNLKIFIEGEENIPNLPSALIVANHSSYLDVFVVGVAFYKQLIKIKWVISKSNYKRWFLKWIYAIYPVIVVNGTIEKAKNELKKNRWVVLFPEGAQNWCAPENRQVRGTSKGAAVIALSTGTTVIPVHIYGADKVLPPTSFKLNPKHIIRVCIGKPFVFGAMQQAKIDEALLEETTNAIMNAICYSGYWRNQQWMPN